MQFTAEQEELLIEEIAELDDAIALQVLIIDADTNETIGSANVELWAMIEDSVHLLRKVSIMYSILLYFSQLCYSFHYISILFVELSF